ncbi:hypothetical protein BDY24DRAFT_382301 [Mrakia frigida]|uniref:uncharacterized protein n=1 Tax=Mrakia frigida TaxID=29902 RepID=UPI003FCC06B5
MVDRSKLDASFDSPDEDFPFHLNQSHHHTLFRSLVKKNELANGLITHSLTSLSLTFHLDLTSHRNPFLLHPPIHPLLPHQHHHHPNAVPHQAQYNLQSAPPSSPLLQLSSSPSSLIGHPLAPISSSSTHTPPPPPPSSIVHSSSSPLSAAALRHPIPTRPHHRALLLLQQEQQQQQEQQSSLAFDEALEEEAEVEHELELAYEEAKEKKYDFYFSGGGKTKVEQEGAVGVREEEQLDLFRTKTTQEQEARTEVSISVLKWDKGKVVEKDPLEIRQALAQKKASLGQGQDQQPSLVRSSSSKKAPADSEAHRPNFLAQDLALGSTSSPTDQPSSAESPSSSLAPVPSTAHLPPSAFSSRSCARAHLASERLFSSRMERGRVLGLEGGKKSGKMRVVERERLEEGLEKRLGRVLGWRL